jgi:membrane protein implicated in regulation of membrane protease activity
MEIAPATFWWVAAGLAVAVELATGTFYLLMLALGFAAGAIAAHAGLGGSGQIVAAALVGGGATATWRWRRSGKAGSAPVAENRDANLDIGSHVHVTQWSPDGTTRVQYRGSAWMARLAPGATAAAGEHVVRAVEGNWLVLAPVAER